MKGTSYEGKTPQIDPTAWIHPSCTIVGNVKIGANTKIYPGCVIRGDIAPVTIGNDVVIQDGVLINPAMGNPTKIGENTLIAFGAIVHGAKVGKNCVIGIRSVLMPGVTVEDDSLIGAFSFILKGKIPSGKVYMGIPAKEKREMRDADRKTWEFGKKIFREVAEKYE